MTMTVLGRVHWDSEHRSPWVSFKNKTEYEAWVKQIREVSDLKTEFQYFDTITPAALLQSATERYARKAAGVNQITIKKTKNHKPWQVSIQYMGRSFVKRRYFASQPEAVAYADEQVK